MRYSYTCENENCENFEKEIVIDKPSSEASKDEYCEKCQEKLRRIYGCAGHATFSDGYKG